MRDFPSCFGESGIQITSEASPSSLTCSTKNPQNAVTCHYLTLLAGRSCVISVTWIRSLIGHGLSIKVDDYFSDQCICKLDIKPWLFSKKKGSRSMIIRDGKVNVFWDMSAAKFDVRPEPTERFYVAVLFNIKMVLLLGDMRKEAHCKAGVRRMISNTVFISRREHVYGKKIYSAKTHFYDGGEPHDIVIDCDTVGQKDPFLEIRIDGKPVMQVKRLAWKFRGNQMILVDGMPVEVLWDVHGWLFGSAAPNAVFMFRTSRVPEKSIPWLGIQTFKEPRSEGLGFSLILHAWKLE